MKKIIFLAMSFTALGWGSCGNKDGEQADVLPMDTMHIKTAPPADDPIDTMVQGHYRYETTDKAGTGPDSTR